MVLIGNQRERYYPTGQLSDKEWRGQYNRDRPFKGRMSNHQINANLRKGT